MSFDEQLYNRQVYAVGADAQRKYSVTDILLVGLSGLGVEIAKNLILTGIRSVTLLDEAPVTFYDLSTNFYASEKDVGANRVDVVLAKLAELNTNVTLSKSPITYGAITADYVKKFTVVIVVDGSYSDPHTVQIDEWCRSSNVRFITCESRGLCANIFVDLGDAFTIYDKNGDEYPNCIVNTITADGVVMCHDDVKHNLEEGDYVSFSDLTGGLASLCGPDKFHKVKDVTSPFYFIIELPEGRSINSDGYTRGGMVRGVKRNVTMAFKSLAENLKNPECIMSDLGKFDNPPQLHLFFQALHAFRRDNGNNLPRAGNNDDAAKVLGLMKSLNTDNVEYDEALYQQFAKGAIGSFVGITSFIGGIAAHEVLKAASGKFTPIKQFYFFDARECLPPAAALTEEECKPRNSRYDGQIAVFGATNQRNFENQRYFVVGAGALGCELLKNFAVSGVGCGREGKVVVTDMDTIEKSNLSRQFLFRAHDIGSLKSKVAGDAAKVMNPNMNVVAMHDKVAPETDNIFNDDFWENLTGVCTALDNVMARQYVDGRCVYYRRPMVDSGTLGSQANAQVVIPNVTESYSSSVDPPEKSIPVCTLKNFPSQTEHTIQWARDALEGLFTTEITEVQQYLTNPSFLKQLDKEPGMKPLILLNIKRNLANVPKTFDQCIQYARERFEEYFNNNIAQLLHNFPEDSVTPSGAPFWSGPKRPPRPLTFSKDDDMHIDFIQACAQLRAAAFSIRPTDQQASRAYIAERAAAVPVTRFEPKKVKIETDPEKKEQPVTLDVEITEKDLPPVTDFASLVPHLSPLAFEKDDDANFHIAFITSCSNLRATNYKLPTADFNKTKMIAGRIIPAMVTTTALITGIVLMEVAKLVCVPKANWSLTLFRNSFVNLAVAFTAFSDPIAPKVNHYGPASNPKLVSWTLWDIIEIDLGRDVTFQELMDYFMTKLNLEVSMVSCGTSLVFSSFAASAKVRLPMKVSDVVREVSKKDIPPHQRFLTFDIICSYDGNDVEVPSIRYKFRF
eukprot:PhF_6_TR27979/c0_g1_i1/m.41415/K03178/UBE1, UBA1; ubiquitin-activating enzyme E1